MSQERKEQVLEEVAAELDRKFSSESTESLEDEGKIKIVIEF